MNEKICLNPSELAGIIAIVIAVEVFFRTEKEHRIVLAIGWGITAFIIWYLVFKFLAPKTKV